MLHIYYSFFRVNWAILDIFTFCCLVVITIFKAFQFCTFTVKQIVIFVEVRCPSHFALKLRVGFHIGTECLTVPPDGSNAFCTIFVSVTYINDLVSLLAT